MVLNVFSVTSVTSVVKLFLSPIPASPAPIDKEDTCRAGSIMF
jgi:hypothetical protein